MMVDASTAAAPGAVSSVLPEKDASDDGGYGSGGWKRYTFKYLFCIFL